MNAFIRFLVVLLLLVATAVATFLATTWRCREEFTGERRLLAAANQRLAQLEEEVAAATREQERLSVWGDFIRMTQDLNAVDRHLNELNFGDAIEAVDAVAKGLSLGEYGTLFRERRAGLLPLLERTRQELRQKSERARVHLVELEREAFAILSGIARPPELPRRLDPVPPDAGEGDREQGPEGVAPRGETPSGRQEPTPEPPTRDPPADDAAAGSEPDAG
ncbi:MAG TPA: hypothetical protein VMT16_04990 [Thermoanaerobaculia bacterium]|nr:hypothetical protein [Thermoanaerobaculia bacterium]